MVCKQQKGGGGMPIPGVNNKMRSIETYPLIYWRPKFKFELFQVVPLFNRTEWVLKETFCTIKQWNKLTNIY